MSALRPATDDPRAAGDRADHDDLATLPASLLQGEVARIVASAAFRNSPRHCRFLEYLVAHALRGDGSRVKEMILGIEVFDRRPSSFDPQRDTIVRVEARRLRARLARYYAEEGAGSLIEIGLPLGSYRPVIRRRAGVGRDASLAVLPIVDRSDAAPGPALCDDVSDALIEAVARVPGFKVIAHDAARRAGRDGAPPLNGATTPAVVDIARRLGVALLLRGTLDHDGRALRLKLGLVRGDDASRLWAATWTLAADSDFAQRDALVARVVADVQRALAGCLPMIAPRPDDAGATVASRAAVPAVDPRARDLVDRGRYLMRHGTVDMYPQALQRFREAAAIAPHYAAAHFGIARSLSYLLGMTQIPPAAGVDEARRAAREALRLDPLHGDAASLLAALRQRYEHDWRAAQAGYLSAIALAPGSLYVHFNYAFGLMFSGRFDEAEAELRLAHELDPLDLNQRATQALLAFYRRDYGRAATLLGALIDDEPRHLLAHSLLGALHLLEHRADAALDAYSIARSLAPTISIGAVGIAQALAVAGRRAAALAARDALVEDFRDRYLSPYQLALVDLRLGHHDAAFAALERAASEHDPNFIAVLVDPSLDAARTDGRFAALLARHRLDRVLPTAAD